MPATPGGSLAAPDASTGSAPATEVDLVAQLEHEKTLISDKLAGMKAAIAAKNDEIKAAKAAQKGA